MDVQGYGWGGVRDGALWLDGLDGQEDELDDVAKGKLRPPTDDEDGRLERVEGRETLAEMERKVGIKLPN